MTALGVQGSVADLAAGMRREPRVELGIPHFAAVAEVVPRYLCLKKGQMFEYHDFSRRKQRQLTGRYSCRHLGQPQRMTGGCFLGSGSFSASSLCCIMLWLLH